MTLETDRKLIAILRWYEAFGVNVLFFDTSNVASKVKPMFSIPHCVAKHDVIRSQYPDNLQNNFTRDNLSNLYKEIYQLDCPIKRTARNTVISDGNPQSKIMLIGEAPGQDEDIQGKPFVGQSGTLLNNMLKAVNINRSDVFISNIVFWRPPGNRTPSPEEISLCLPYAKRLIKLISPRVIMLLGSVAVHALLETSLPISKIRGRLVEVLGIKTIPTYHPAYLLRSSIQKKLAFNDFLLLAKC